MNQVPTSLCLAQADLCTGCGSCAAICPADALTMKEDSEGFLRPNVNYDKCLRCGKCGRACPVTADKYEMLPLVCLIARSKDPSLRRQSSSGAIFPVLAKKVIASGGAVYGAEMAFPSCSVNHARIEDDSQISRLQGSKYVQGDAACCFREVNDDLAAGKQVLFSGLPCQVAALRSYLGNIPDNLILVDVICHGAPSLKVFLRYRDYIKASGSRSDIVGFSFRDKTSGWQNASSCWILQDGTGRTTIPDNLFTKAFTLDLFSRPSCHQCPFRNWRSGSDITIGDHWDVASRPKEWNDETGISSVMIRSKKGRSFWSSIPVSDVLSFETSVATVLGGNPSLVCSPRKNRCRRLFFFLLRHCSFGLATNISLRLDWILSLPGHFQLLKLRKRFGRGTK